jgi:hypothetical protein
MEDKEDEEEGKEQGRNGKVGKGSEEIRENYFGWLSLVDQVSETERISWNEAFSLNIFEFFNILSYSRWKANKQKEQIEKWKRTH